MAYGPYNATGAARRRANAANTLQRAARSGAAQRSRSITASTARAIMSHAETQVLRKAYIDTIQRWNEPGCYGGILWCLPLGVSMSSGTHVGWHNGLESPNATLRKSSEIYTKYIKFQVTMTSHEALNNVKARWLLIEFDPTEELSNKLIVAATTAASKFGASASNTASANEIPELWIGSDGRGAKSYSQSQTFPRIHDTINKNTRQKFTVLRDIYVDLSRGAEPLPGNWYTRDEHVAGADDEAMSQSETAPISMSNQANLRFPNASLTNDGAKESFHGAACCVKKLQFSVPYKRKVEYRNTMSHSAAHSSANTNKFFTESCPVSRDLMWVCVPSIGDHSVYTSGSTNNDPATTTPAASQMHLPLVSTSVYSEVFYSDP